jgi:hypothetical protein
VVGNISFAPRINFNCPYFPRRVKLADMDGDGKQDLVLLTEDSLSIMRCTTTNGNISFAPPVNYTLLTAGSGYVGSEDMSVADFDNDGKLDVAITNAVGFQSVSLFKNSSIPGTIAFAIQPPILFGIYEPGSIDVNDLDGDGMPEISIGSRQTSFTSERTIGVIKNNCSSGSFLFGSPQYYKDVSGQYWWGGMTSADLNGDNMPEIIMTTSNSGPASAVLVFKNNTSTYLPVALTYINATCTDKGTKLVWKTATEINSDHFEIEKGSNGADWNLIGSIKAIGNSTVENQYQFIDHEASNALYRLKQIDKDAKFTYSSLVKADCKTEQQTLSVYPVPAKNILHIQLSSTKNDRATVQFMDMLGKVQKQQTIILQKGNNAIPLNIQSLIAGTYLLKISNEDFTKTQKVVVCN